MQFNSKYVFQCQNAIFAKGDFSLRFVSACVCSDLDLCHVSELGSRQMGLVLGCTDVVEIIFGTNNLTGVIDIDIKIEIKRSWGLCASCQVGPRCQHLDDSVIATAIVDLPSSLSSPPPSPWTQHRSSSLYEICICAKIIQ